MPITKNQIKKIEEAIVNREAKYQFCGVQIEGIAWSIVELKDDREIRRFSSDSDEGNNLIKNHQVRHPNRIIILDGK